MSDGASRSESSASRTMVALAMSLAVCLVLALRQRDVSRLSAHARFGHLASIAGAGLIVATSVLILARRRDFGRSAFARVLAVAAVTVALVAAAIRLLWTVQIDSPGNAVPFFLAGVGFTTAALAAALAAGAVAGQSGVPARAARAVRRVAVSALVLCASGLAVEAWVAPALLADWYEVRTTDGSGAQLHEPDPELYWRMRPHFEGRLLHPEIGGALIATNSLGLRDREPEEIPDGERTIVLGDSFAFGLGLKSEDTLSARLVALGVAPAAVNAGVCGFGTFDEALFLDRIAGRLAPAVVVALVYTGNDVGDNLAFLRRHAKTQTANWIADRFPGAEPFFERAANLTEAEWRIPSDLRRGSPLLGWLASRSRFGRLVVDALDRPAASRGESPRGAPVNAILLRSLAKSPDDEIRFGFEATGAALRALDERARRIGARFLACLVPALLQVEPGLLADVAERASLDPDSLDADRPQAEIVAACASGGIECVDLTPEYRGRIARGEILYFAEGHWRKAAVDLAAEAIGNRLRREPSVTAPR